MLCSRQLVAMAAQKQLLAYTTLSMITSRLYTVTPETGQ